MSLPIDEMLTDLRAVLEAYDAAPSADTFDAIYKETNRINHACEDDFFGHDE